MNIFKLLGLDCKKFGALDPWLGLFIKSIFAPPIAVTRSADPAAFLIVQLKKKNTPITED